MGGPDGPVGVGCVCELKALIKSFNMTLKVSPLTAGSDSSFGDVAIKILFDILI